LVRESLRAGSVDAYNENELRLAAACATLGCPHPYLALANTARPTEIWWLNAFASPQERDGLAEAYARNEALMAVLVPLGKRKEDFRESLTTIRLTHRADLDGRSGLRVAGARFLVISTTTDQGQSAGSVFQSGDGERFRIASASTPASAEEAAAQFGAGAIRLAGVPQ